MTKRVAVRAKRQSRFETMTDEEITKKWRDAVPRFARWIVLFGAAVVGLFVYNMIAKPGQGVTNIINVAFQISAIFLVCFVVMLAMGLYFGREKKPR